MKNNKAKAHIQYKLDNGTKVPGVTTILGILNKPALVAWSNKLGLAGIEVGKYVDSLADIGTLAHAMALFEFKKLNGDKPTPIDTSEYSAQQIDQAENCLLSLLEWMKGKDILPFMMEVPLVSEDYGYGGTPDFFGSIDGVTTLLDIKTGSGIYPEHWLQLSAYEQLVIELSDKPKIEQFIILNIPRAENENFTFQVKTDLSKHFLKFAFCLEIYKLNKILNK